MSARETVLDYYEALRRGEPLAPYFAERSDTVKIGVFSRTVGFDAVAESLREQTRTTDDWTVESRDLRVASSETDEAAWFTDTVDLSWDDTSDTSRAASFAYETRWSGVLEPRGDGGAREWVFATMHVSAPHQPDGDAA
jgi:hypothetical protein